MLALAHASALFHGHPEDLAEIIVLLACATGVLFWQLLGKERSR
jgi:hypothetical protein